MYIHVHVIHCLYSMSVYTCRTCILCLYMYSGGHNDVDQKAYSYASGQHHYGLLIYFMCIYVHVLTHHAHQLTALRNRVIVHVRTLAYMHSYL